jgi:prolyl-tRNA synthetase
MKFHELNIETQRQAPAGARTEGFALLVRAGYLTRENSLTRLGEHAVDHLRELQAGLGDSFFASIGLGVIGRGDEKFFALKTGSIEVAHCPACNYTERIEMARFAKPALPSEGALPLEKVSTPGCNTIDSLADFLGISKEKTAKALMFTRRSDGRFIFVVVRGDMQLSEAKLKRLVGDFGIAGADEIARSGAAAGYASPVGLRGALIVADDLLPHSANLVAGANEAGWHFRNVNYGRDYSAEILADIVRARAGDACPDCGSPLSVLAAEALQSGDEYRFETILRALAEVHHDDRGLSLPSPAAPFDVYLMQLAGKEFDTHGKAEEIHAELQTMGISVLFDDRDERAGVKFNDADLIGCPLRLTVGEKNLREGMVELKPRNGAENRLVVPDQLAAEIKNLLK